MVDLSVIVPAYNEEGIIVKTVEEIKRVLENANIDYEIVVVDDGSEDKTYLVVKKRFSRDPRVIVVRKENGGKGSAIKFGFKFTSGKIIAFKDADLEIHPSYITKMVKELKNRGVDGVIGSKRIPGASFWYPPLRRVLSRAYWMLVRVLFKLSVTDTQIGIKVFRREALEEILPRILCKRYAFDVELLANLERRGYKLLEYPVRSRFQRKKSRIRIGDVWKMLLDTLAIYYRMKILKYYDKEGSDENSLVKLEGYKEP